MLPLMEERMNSSRLQHLVNNLVHELDENEFYAGLRMWKVVSVEFRTNIVVHAL